MKVGILTFHRADNYGAVLQVFALMSYLSTRYNTCIIDYRCDAIENDYCKSVIPPLRRNVFKWSYELLRRSYFHKYQMVKHRKFEAFRNTFLELSSSVRTDSDRERIQMDYDVIITGSDQLWNGELTHGKDNWYCFRQAATGKAKVISYAVSVGNLEKFRKQFPDYHSDLDRYYALSVREEETRAFLEGNVNPPVTTVIDPTLLLGKKEWESVISADSIYEGDYILYYDVEFNEVSKSIADQLSYITGLKILHFCEKFIIDKRYVYVGDLGVEEFLATINRARYIVTSSFHATVFSIIFRKSFIVVPHPRTGTRVISMLKSLGIDNRICVQPEDFSIDKINDEIPFDMVEEKLKTMRRESDAFITNSIDFI